MGKQTRRGRGRRQRQRHGMEIDRCLEKQVGTGTWSRSWSRSPGLSRSSPKPKQDWSAACTWMPRRRRIVHDHHDDDDEAFSHLFTGGLSKGAVTSFECLERKKNELECLRFNGGLAFSQITKSYIHSFWYICVWRLKQSNALYVWSPLSPSLGKNESPKFQI